MVGRQGETAQLRLCEKWKDFLLEFNIHLFGMGMTCPSSGSNNSCGGVLEASSGALHHFRVMPIQNVPFPCHYEWLQWTHTRVVFWQPQTQRVSLNANETLFMSNRNLTTTICGYCWRAPRFMSIRSVSPINHTKHSPYLWFLQNVIAFIEMKRRSEQEMLICRWDTASFPRETFWKSKNSSASNWIRLTDSFRIEMKSSINSTSHSNTRNLFNAKCWI